MTNKVELHDDELSKVSGGVIQAPNEKGQVCNIVVGDVVDIKGYIAGTDGQYCLVSINQYERYKFVKYTKGAKYVEIAISFTVKPNGMKITIIGHDDEFVIYNA